jgi:hypothetical protein
MLKILQVILEQLSRPEERRCPIAKASNEVVELLSEHWAIFAPGCVLYFLGGGVETYKKYATRFNINDLPTILP